MGCKLTLISASAGFGKTTLVSEWIARCGRPVAWLSLDEGDNDPARFISYLVKAFQMVKAGTGEGLLAALQSPQPLQIEVILISLLNEVSAIPGNFLLVLDDYHSIDSQPVDRSLAFIIEHQPPQMHILIATREDPDLPLARLRARGQCTELRAADLRFTPAEIAEFLNPVMGLSLSAQDVAALEARTEGWIAGLQLAAISMRGYKDAAGFIQSFTGSHRFVMDYLLEEVLHQQPKSIQMFLLRTSILDRICGSLCDAILLDPSVPGQATLEYLERANLFITPLDDERCWYRYHHLFADLLRKRLGQSLAPEEIAVLHIHASEWHEKNDLILDAFRHAAAANDIERAERLMESRQMPLYLRGAVTTLLGWLESLPTSVLDARPALWWRQAQMMLLGGQIIGVEEKLQAAEAALAAAALPDAELDGQTRDLIGRIAAIRSNLALVHRQAETMLVQGQRALEYLHPNSLGERSSATRDMGFAYYIQGNRSAAGRTFTEALSLARASGDLVEPLLATIGLAQIQELENQIHLAAGNYQNILPQIGDHSPLNAGVVHFGLARIYYEWNDLDAAEQHGQQSLQLAQQYNQIINRFIMTVVFLARLKLVQGNFSDAENLLAQAEQAAHQNNFMHPMPEVAAVQVLLLIHQGQLTAAAELAGQYEIPISQARVFLSQANPSAALAVLNPFRQQMESKDWRNECLKTMVLQAVAHRAHGDQEKALELLGNSLALAEPGGFVRLFVDEGPPMAELLTKMKADSGRMREYIHKLLAAFGNEKDVYSSSSVPQSLMEPLSPRELAVLRLIAQGLSNQEICERLFLALDTVKGHNRRIFDKLQVQRRTEAILRARELGLL